MILKSNLCHFKERELIEDEKLHRYAIRNSLIYYHDPKGQIFLEDIKFNKVIEAKQIEQ